MGLPTDPIATYRRVTTPEKRTWPLTMLLDETGLLTAGELQALLAVEFRPVQGVEFRACGELNKVLWRGMAGGQRVGGELKMRCQAYARDSYVAWVEISIDAMTMRSSGQNTARPRERSAESRLKKIADLTRDVIRSLHTKPRVATPDLIAAHAGILDEAEPEDHRV